MEFKQSILFNFNIIQFNPYHSSSFTHSSLSSFTIPSHRPPLSPFPSSITHSIAQSTSPFLLSIIYHSKQTPLLHSLLLTHLFLSLFHHVRLPSPPLFLFFNHSFHLPINFPMPPLINTPFKPSHSHHSKSTHH